MPEMHTTVVRFGEGLWRLIEEDAKRRNVSIAEWLRIAAALRIGFQAAREADEMQNEIYSAVLDGEKQRNGGSRSGAKSKTAGRR